MNQPTAITTLQERCLASFFKLQLLVGGFVSREELMRVFDASCDIFLIPQNERESLWTISQADEIQTIRCESDYNLYKRIQEYLRLSGEEIDTAQEMVANIRGRAIMTLKEANYNVVLDSTKPATYSFLTNASQCGMIEAMKALGLLQILGVFTAKAENSGLRLMNRCAKWNDPDAILTMLAYDEESREVNMSRLLSVSNGTPFESIVESAKEAYGFTSVKMSGESELIEQAIGLNIIKSQVYYPQVSRIVYSEILEHSDKIRLVLNNKNIVAEMNDLPLALKRVPLVATDTPDGGMLEREAERENVVQSILYASETNALCPCLVTDDAFVAQDYIEMITKSFPEANVIDIEASALKQSDFNADKNHFFVRDLVEDKRNLILFVIKGKANQAVAELLSKYLRDTDRDDFRLAMPGITLNLSSVLPVCICDTECLKYIKPFCDCIELSALTESEIGSLIDKLIARRKIDYQITELTLEDDARRALIEGFKSFSSLVSALDKLIYSFKGKGSGKVITEKMVQALIQNADKRTKLGF